MKFTDNALTVLEARYLRKDENGNIIETPEQMIDRVASFLADTDEAERMYHDLMFSLDFLPNTPTLINAGRPNGQLSACFVLPIEDSMEGIFTTVKNAALIHKTGGGTGFSFSRLRHRGGRVSSTGGEASGVVSFLRVFNAATDSVKQGGVRRGANMGLLRIDHPDIEEFIMCKDDTTQLTNFNLSVGVTDDFMAALDRVKDWQLIDPHTHQVVKTVPAEKLWNMIVHQAWKNGEPGIVFLDKINAQNPTPQYGEIEATNPCGEQPLLPYESCNLGSINLANHVTPTGCIDREHLERTTRWAVCFLNDVLDHNTFPLPEIKESTLRTRKIGLGVMGFADMLIKLNVPYDSDKAVKLAEEAMSIIQTTAHEYSKLKHFENATCTTIAPTGTISMLANVSSGIEPNFSWVYTRRSCDKELYVVHPLMEKWLKMIGLYNDDVLQELKRGTPVREIPALKNIVCAPVWTTSQEISPAAHIRIQAAFQKYTDNAVSKTINLPNNATETDVEQAYLLAYENGCKGVTVYRDGSRDSQVLNHEPPKKEEATGFEGVKAVVRPRPVCVEGSTVKKQIGCGTLYVTVNRDENGPIEVFTNTGKAGGCPAQSEGLSRMVSLALRYNIPVDAICKQLCGIRCMSTIRKDGCRVLSCPDAIGRSLKDAVENNLAEHAGRIIAEGLVEGLNRVICPDCGQPLEQAEGCVICHGCGYSKCG